MRSEIRLFQTLKMFYPPKGVCKADPTGDYFDSFHFIVVREGYLTLSKSQLSDGLFEILKMFYPPKGVCTAEYRWRSNCFYLCIIVLGNVYWIFSFALLIRLLEPSKCFIPRRDSAQQSTEGGPLILP